MIIQQCLGRTYLNDTGCSCPTTGSGTRQDPTLYYKGCQFQQSYPQINQTKVLNQDLIPYGDGCFYSVETQCGYPSVTFTGSNLDIVMGYNTSLWNGMANNNS